MEERVSVPAFQRPIEPQDEWTARLYQRHGFGANPSLEEVEAKATELLSNPLTAIAGAEIVLGRRVDGNREKEPDVLPLIATPGLSGSERFGLLLMQRDIESAMAREAKKQ